MSCFKAGTPCGSALHGVREKDCDFGVDYTRNSQNSSVPHATMMLHLSRLVTMAGIDAKIEGDNRKAVELFFDCYQMGRHLDSATTLVETHIGMEIMENASFALAFWAARCDDPALISSAFKRFEQMALPKLKMAATLEAESRVFDAKLEQVKAAYPDGNWAEMILEAWGELAEGDDRAGLQARLLELAGERGYTPETFKDKDAFLAAASKVEQLHADYFAACAGCVKLEEPARAKKAAELYRQFQPKFEAAGDAEFLDIRHIVRHQAANEAESELIRGVLGICASRKGGKYPSAINAVAAQFGGRLPKSPYNGAPLEYQVLNDGQDFLIAVPELTIMGVVYPRVEFSSVRQVEE